MEELIRFDHASTAGRLNDYCLSIYKGEILYVQSVNRPVLRSIAEILDGTAQLDNGYIDVQGKKLKKLSYEELRKQHVYSVNFRNTYSDNLSIADNILLKPNQVHWYTRARSDENNRIVEQYFSKMGVSISGARKMGGLNEREKRIVKLLTGGIYQASLIILDLSHHSSAGFISDEILRLIDQMHHHGIGFLILSDQYSRIAEMAERIQVVRDGRDGKEWYGLNRQVEDYLRHEPEEEIQQMDAWSDQRWLYGLEDSAWGGNGSLHDYLQKVKDENPDVWKKYFDVEIPSLEFARNEKAVLIPYDSADQLLKNMTITENLTIADSSRVSAHGRYGKVEERLEKKLARDFYQLFSLPESVVYPSQLSILQKRVLSIHRYTVTRPSVIFLEEPYSMLSPQQIPFMRAYLKDVCSQRIKVVCVTYEAAEFGNDCRVMIDTENGRCKKIHSF